MASMVGSPGTPPEIPTRSPRCTRVEYSTRTWASRSTRGSDKLHLRGGNEVAVGLQPPGGAVRLMSEHEQPAVAARLLQQPGLLLQQAEDVQVRAQSPGQL